MANEIVVQGNADVIRDFDDVVRISKAMAASGYFDDAKDVAQAIDKVMAGREMGFGPFAAMSGVHIIKGKPAPGANIMAAAVKKHPAYDYRVRHMDDTKVALEFFEHGESVGFSEFTAEDARRAGTQNMGKFPRNMLFARAMSNGVKWFTPDVFNGSTVYTPEELGEIEEPPRIEIIKPDAGEATDSAPATEPPPTTTTPTEPPPTSTEEAHWTTDKTALGRFWAWTKTLGLLSDQVHDALEVDSVKDFTGSKAEAMGKITAYAEGLRAVAAMQADEAPEAPQEDDGTNDW